MRFADITGQEDLKRHLTQSVDAGRLSHAQLFTGTAGDVYKRQGQLIAVRSGDGERETAFTPAHDIASMTVYGVLEAVERSGQTTFDLGQTPELARIDRELETLKESARRSQDNVRLTDLL